MSQDIAAHEAESTMPSYKKLLIACGLTFAFAHAHADEYQALVSRFGRPDFVDSTENDKPRPPIPVKWAEYRRARVKAVFVPDAGMGEPPPYRGWKLVGYADMDRDARISDSEAASRLASNRKK